MNRAHNLEVLFILLVTFVAGAAAQNGVVTTTVTRLPLSGEVEGCTEKVYYNGSVQLVNKVWVDANGATHDLITTSANAKGVGENSANDYIVQSGDVIEITSTDQKPPFETTYLVRQGLIGAGPAPNERLLSLFHQTVNADGSTTTEFTKWVQICK